MEGYFGSEARRRPPPPLEANIGCNRDLTLSNSDASSLSAENCKDVYRRSVNVTPDDCSAWTDEKHNFYLRRLELSFVEQLFQLKSSLTHCSEQNQRKKHTSQKQMINNSEQYTVLRNGCRQKINCVRDEPLPSSTSAGSHDSVKRRRKCNLKHMGVHCHPLSAEVPAYHRKGMISSETLTCLQEFSSPNPCGEDLSDLIREGMGQNFLDEDNQSTSNFKTQAKRLKTALKDGSHQDQVSVLPGSTIQQISQSSIALHVEKSPHIMNLSQKFERFVHPPTLNLFSQANLSFER